MAVRQLAIEKGRFGNGLHIQDGSPISKGTWNESGLDCDLVVAVLWGEWHKKPHYWGAGAFHGDRGTVAFWVKPETLRGRHQRVNQLFHGQGTGAFLRQVGDILAQHAVDV